MSSAFLQVGLFLVNFVFGFYIMLLMLRFLLQWVKADFYNPICQFLIRLTNPLLVPLRRVIPGFFGLDMAAVVLMVILQLLELYLLSLLTHFPASAWMIAAAVLKLLQLLLNVYFFAIIIRAIISWLNPHPLHPGYIILCQLTEPVLAPARKIIPTISGIDLSPLVVLVLLQVLSIFLQVLI